jgi:hypothetical protein
MIRLSTFVSALVVLFTLSACGKQDSANETAANQAASAAVVYDCPMHPEVTQSTPGKCPKCGMTLVEVKPATLAAHEHAPGEPAHDHGASPAPHSDHNPKHGGMLGMQGDYHLELVARHGGDLDVYLYDAYTRPIAVSGNGQVRLEMPGGAPEVTVPIRPLADAAAFHGHSEAADEALSATIDVTHADTTLSMSFPLQATLTGEIVDIDCMVRLGEAGRGSIHAECASDCIRNGMPVGLAVGKTVYVITLAGAGPDRAANERLAELAGRQVSVTGRIREASGIKMIELADVQPVSGS